MQQPENSRVRSGETKRHNSQRTILAGAAGAFALDGYADTTLVSLVSELNKVSTATLLNHFETKSTLGLAVIDSTYSSMVKNEAYQSKVASVHGSTMLFAETLGFYSGVFSALTDEMARTGKPLAALLPNVHESISTAANSDETADICISLAIAAAMCGGESNEQAQATLSIMLDGIVPKT